MVSLPSEFRASLESYSGPLDLLLYLIKKEEVDIFDIPLARIIEQYQVYLELLQELDPNACGEFLVMAAQLMEIKSKLLLPRETLEAGEEELEDPRLELVRQLLEYKKFKERALLLERRLEEHSRRYRRPALRLAAAEEEEEPESPEYLGEVSVWDLLTAFHKIQIALGQRMPIQVVLGERPVEDFMRDIVALLETAGGGPLAFDELFQGARSRSEAIGIFLALLELAKSYRVRLAQEELFGPITVELRSLEETRRLEEDEARASPAEGREAAEASLLQGERPPGLSPAPDEAARGGGAGAGDASAREAGEPGGGAP